MSVIKQPETREENSKVKTLAENIVLNKTIELDKEDKRADYYQIISDLVNLLPDEKTIKELYQYIKLTKDFLNVISPDDAYQAGQSRAIHAKLKGRESIDIAFREYLKFTFTSIEINDMEYRMHEMLNKFCDLLGEDNKYLITELTKHISLCDGIIHENLPIFFNQGYKDGCSIDNSIAN